MPLPHPSNTPLPILAILNQLFQIEQKLSKLSEPNTIQRNIERIKEEFTTLGYTFESPLGQKYNETRTDCEASISGNSVENLVVTEVLKPVIRAHYEGSSFIVQRAVIIVEGKK